MAPQESFNKRKWLDWKGTECAKSGSRRKEGMVGSGSARGRGGGRESWAPQGLAHQEDRVGEMKVLSI